MLWYNVPDKEAFIMNKRSLEAEIAELKMDYISLQGDIEKLESTGHETQVQKAEQRLADMEARLSQLNKQMDEFD